MKNIIILCISWIFLINSVQIVNAQSIQTPTPDLQQLDNTTSGSAVLGAFISGFDWISNGLVFHTPELLDKNITLSDGTQLSGVSQYRNIFYSIATPIFVIIITAVALIHMTRDDSIQLKMFLKRLLSVVMLFILTPQILSYSIQSVNLLDSIINAQNAFNLSSFISAYLSSGDMFKILLSLLPNSSLSIFAFISPNTFASAFPAVIMEILLFLITLGFFLFGFVYIIFQAIIRFIALLFLSILFPIALPFALSERTEHITNTYFKVWFTFLIQQPAFVLGFAVISAIFGSILKAHGGNIGTLFLFSGSLLFLGGVNVFIAKIFADGWSLISANATSLKASKGLHTDTMQKIKYGVFTDNASGFRSFAGKQIRTMLQINSTTNNEKHIREKMFENPPRKGEWKKYHADSQSI